MKLDNAGYENAAAFSVQHAAQFSQSLKAGDISPLWLDWLETKMGPMLAICDAQYLFMLEFTTRKAMQGQFEKLHKTRGRPIKLGRTKITDQIGAELTEYFAGRLSAFKTPLMPTGTEFQTATWEQLCNIPHGQTRSYAQLAKMVGNPKAVRAVASANARNGLALIIPCHRVIASDGGLGGYAGGVSRKGELLALES